MTAEQVQRNLSTEEKLGTVLPMILNTESPRDAQAWSEFGRLKRARDSTIHMKPQDAYAGGKIDKQTLFHEFFSMPSLMGFPLFSLEVISFFSKPDKEESRWLTSARELANQLHRTTKPTGGSD